MWATSQNKNESNVSQRLQAASKRPEKHGRQKKLGYEVTWEEKKKEGDDKRQTRWISRSKAKKWRVSVPRHHPTLGSMRGLQGRGDPRWQLGSCDFEFRYGPCNIYRLV